MKDNHHPWVPVTWNDLFRTKISDLLTLCIIRANENYYLRLKQGVPVYFIYADYNFLYLWNQIKLTLEGKENSLHNIKAGTL